MYRYYLLCCCILACQGNVPAHSVKGDQEAIYRQVQEIPVPAGFARTADSSNSFAAWLRDRKLKADKTVYLYNGQRKPNQEAQFAVLDVPVGDRDLQQCADAIMRLRAEYLFDQKRTDEIAFMASSGQTLSFARWVQGYRYRVKGNNLEEYKSNMAGANTRKDLDQYLQLVFTYCGTSSLSRQMRPMAGTTPVQAGDVFIAPGFPGHAMLVVDVAIKEGKRIFMLAQSYMPAQDIHIVKNNQSGKLSPWYEVPATGGLRTPEWYFNGWPLYRW